MSSEKGTKGGKKMGDILGDICKLGSAVVPLFQYQAPVGVERVDGLPTALLLQQEM